MHAPPGGDFAAESATPDDVLALWGDGSDLWLTTEGGGVLRRGNTGAWTTVFTHNHSLDGMWGSTGAGVIHVVGFASHLKGSTMGFTDDPIVNAPTGFLVAVWGSGPKDVYIVGGRGTILHLAN
jgi:hypothetical protein